MFFLQNNSFETEKYVFIGTRGWVSPKSSEFSEDTDRKIYNRELMRLKLSYDSVKNKEKEIICLFHYYPIIKTYTYKVHKKAQEGVEFYLWHPKE